MKKEFPNMQEDILVMSVEVMDLLQKKIGIVVNALMTFVKIASNLMLNIINMLKSYNNF
jgi:hypothetical protein